MSNKKLCSTHEPLIYDVLGEKNMHLIFKDTTIDFQHFQEPSSLITQLLCFNHV